jgi:hypothetical protein
VEAHLLKALRAEDLKRRLAEANEVLKANEKQPASTAEVHNIPGKFYNSTTSGRALGVRRQRITSTPLRHRCRRTSRWVSQ